jgi:hypothetical protein
MDLLVFETEHAQVALRQGLVAVLIVFDLFVMDPAIQLDIQPSFVAVEIDDESIDHLAPAEM